MITRQNCNTLRFYKTQNFNKTDDINRFINQIITIFINIFINIMTIK